MQPGSGREQRAAALLPAPLTAGRGGPGEMQLHPLVLAV